MTKIISRTFILFVVVFMGVHLLFNIQTQIKNFSWSDAFFTIFIFGLLGSLFAIVTVLLTMIPLQFLKRRFYIKSLTFYVFYYAIIIFVTTYVLYWWGETNTRIDGVKFYPSGLDFYKSLGTLGQIEVLFNYLIALAAATYLDWRTKKLPLTARVPQG